MIYTVVGLKGGVGKTTTAVFLAHILNATLVDADPQRSASEWAQVATASGSPLRFPVIELATPQLASRLPDAQNTIIDCPPGDPAIATAAIDAADLVIIPTGPTALDLSRAWPTIDVVRGAGKPFWVLLTRTRLGTRSVAGVREALRNDGADVFTGTVPLREELAAAWGQPIGHRLHGYEDIAKQLTSPKGNVR